MKIKISEIETTVSLLLTMLKDSIGEEIALDNDYYWEILSEDMYNPYVEPTNFTLGQLSDDITEIRRLKTTGDAIGYDLKRISRILNALSFENQILL